MNLAAYNKAFTILIGGALTWGAQVVASKPNAITAPEWLALAGVGALSFGVRQIPNAPVVPNPRPPLETS